MVEEVGEYSYSWVEVVVDQETLEPGFEVALLPKQMEAKDQRVEVDEEVEAYRRRRPGARYAQFVVAFLGISLPINQFLQECR